MEPLSALAIACATMQTLSFSRDVCSVASRIARDGSPDAALGVKTAHLKSLAHGLDKQLTSQQNAGPLPSAHKLLQDNARKCVEITEKLAKELNKVERKATSSSTKPGGKRSVMGQTATWLWRRKTIDGLRKEMDEILRRIETSILGDLWSTKEAALVQQNAIFGTLDSNLKVFIQNYAQGHRKLEDLVMDQTTALKKEVVVEHTKTRTYIAAELESREQAKATKDDCKQVLESLQFPTMTARKSRVTRAHEATFGWAFDDSVDGRWHSLAQWMKSDERVFWISGKPGSGKSTLMKFLADNPRTKEYLASWKDKVGIVTFFLWNSGALEQRSIQGILCALLYQVLNLSPGIINTLMADIPAIKMKRSYNDWCDEELESTLITAALLTPFPLCIFLDGLDEIDRHDEKGCDDVVRLVESLLSKTNAKLCISSRPERALEPSFKNYPMLRLQDLTRGDIASYVHDFLRDHFEYLDASHESYRSRQDIIDLIINKSSGVFLWVYLVLNNLRRANQNRDSYALLLKRIDQCPEGLEALYQQTWNRQGQDAKFYRTEAARYFKLVMETSQLPRGGPFSLLELAVASKVGIQEQILERGYLPPAGSLAEFAEEFGRRAEVCCGGLLEVQAHNTTPTEIGKPDNKFVDRTIRNILNQFVMPLSAYLRQTSDPKSIPSGSDIARLWKTSYHQRLDFIHRTAADFLLKTQWGRELLDCESGNPADVRVNLYRAHLVQWVLFGGPLHKGDLTGFWPHTIGDLLYTFDDLWHQPIADEWQGAETLLEKVYEKILDQVCTMHTILETLQGQIESGQFDGVYHRVMREFIASYFKETFRGLISRETFKIPPDIYNTESLMIGNLRTIWGACREISDIYHDKAKLSAYLAKLNRQGILTFPVLWRGDSLSSGAFELSFADLVFTSSIQKEARGYLQFYATRTVCLFLLHVSRFGLAGTAVRCIERRRDGFERSIVRQLLLINISELTSLSGELCHCWKTHEIFEFLIRSTSDPNWTAPPRTPRRTTSLVTCQAATALEHFLLSILKDCPSSLDEAILESVAATIRSFIEAGADLERIICLYRGPPISSPWKLYVTGQDGRGVIRLKHPVIIIEQNVHRLLRDVESVLRYRCPTTTLDLTGRQGDGASKGYRKVLFISKWEIRSDLIEWRRNALVRDEDSARIFELLDAENSGQNSESELRDLLEAVLTNGKRLGDPDKWLQNLGHLFNAGLDELLYYDRSCTKELYPLLFPDPKEETHLGTVSGK